MNNSKPTDFAYHLTNYFGVFLPGQKGLSKNTIMSYRDTFTTLLRYCNDILGIAPDKLTIKILTKSIVDDFLEWLCIEKGNSISTRNQRLSAIHAFFRYIQLEAPEHILKCQQILSIPTKKHQQGNINYLTFEGIKSILSMPDLNALSGRRDLVMLSLLYDTGARVSELCFIEVGDIRLESPATIKLNGKGNKIRIVPLMNKTTDLVKAYMKDQNLFGLDKRDHALFWNRQGEKLTPAGVRYILDKYTDEARQTTPEFIPNTVSPHSFRHSKAVHLLQAGVNLIYIRDLLGHANIKTTEIYAKVDPNPDIPPSWHQDKSLMTWLSALSSR